MGGNASCSSTLSAMRAGLRSYDAILDDLQGRPDLLERIKGCVFDSGGDPNINPKVWAAGFAAALLKKCSSATYPSVEAGEENVQESGMTVSKMGQKEPLLVEVIFLVLLEKLFLFLLNMPDINQRLTKIISGLSKNQPPCPQLYLYSTADMVIPNQSLMEEQKKMGRKVWSFNFGSSPHVDHCRTFPTMSWSQLQNFLKECLDMVKQMQHMQVVVCRNFIKVLQPLVSHAEPYCCRPKFLAILLVAYKAWK